MKLVDTFLDLSSLLSVKSITFDSYYKCCQQDVVRFDIGHYTEKNLLNAILQKYFENRKCAFYGLHAVLTNKVFFSRLGYGLGVFQGIDSV